MSEQPELTKAELMERIDSTWTALQGALIQLSEAQLTMARDAAGWAIKDHVMHMAAWERSVVFLLQGLPRHAGLDVDEAVYLNASEDAINAAVFERYHDLMPDDALEQLRVVHAQLLALLRPLSDADLRHPSRDFMQDEAAEGDGPPVINIVYSNTAEHFAEHLDWIQTLAGGARNDW